MPGQADRWDVPFLTLPVRTPCAWPFLCPLLLLQFSATPVLPWPSASSARASSVPVCSQVFPAANDSPIMTATLATPGQGGHAIKVCVSAASSGPRNAQRISKAGLERRAKPRSQLSHPIIARFDASCRADPTLRSGGLHPRRQDRFDWAAPGALFAKWRDHQRHPGRERIQVPPRPLLGLEGCPD